MLCNEVLLTAQRTDPQAVWVSEEKRAYDHEQFHTKAHREGWAMTEAEGYAEQEGGPVLFWKLGRCRYRLVTPDVLKIDGPPLGAKATAEAIARADERFTPIKYDGEWMLWSWNPQKEEPFLVACEYWLVTRAEVFERFAAQAREAADGAAALDGEEEDETPQVDLTLSRDDLTPDSFVFMVNRPFPAVYLEGVTIH